MERIRFRPFHLPSASPNHDSDPEGHGGNDRERHLSASEMKHRFALQLVKESALGNPREYLCHCIRCKWTFQVSPDRGSVVAFNNIGEPLDGPEATKRVATFADGPCPAFADFPEYEVIRKGRTEGILKKLYPVLRTLGLDNAA